MSNLSKLYSQPLLQLEFELRPMRAGSLFNSELYPKNLEECQAHERQYNKHNKYLLNKLINCIPIAHSLEYYIISKYFAIITIIFIIFKNENKLIGWSQY